MKTLTLGFAFLTFAAVGETVYTPETASREARFLNPPACRRILPIHHGWTHDAARAAGEMDAMKEQGFGGFVCNVNFDSNYLHNANSWATLRRTVERAHDLGMALWLYDEKGYPSCTAGGQTLEGHPEWQARAYLVSVTNEPGGAMKVTGVRDGYIREGTHVSVSVSHFKYAYPNLLMREPTDRFIAITHDAYRRELGPALRYFTSTFTDEPSLMTFWMKPMPELCLPVSDELLTAYAAKAGHPLRDDVPALVTGDPVGRTAEIRHRYWTMVGERVARNFTGRITEWTAANGILSGGHLLAEESLVAHVPLYGDFFRVLRGLSAPSCDMLTSIPEQVNIMTPLLAGSAGELNGGTPVMSEASDHCEKYRKPDDKRPQIQVTARQVVGALNRQIWGCVNTFTSYYRWEAFSADEKRAINEEIGRTLTLVSEGRSAAEVAVLYPADTLMTGFEPRRKSGGGTLAQDTAALVNKAVRALFTAGRPFLLVDADTLAAAEVKDGSLVAGPLRWRSVVLPNAVTLPIAAVRKLAALQAAGGQVLALGERPVNSERAFPDAEVQTLAARWTQISPSLGGFLADILARRHAPEIEVTRGSRDALRFAHRRTAKEGDVFFVANDSDQPWTGAVRLAGGGAARVWNPRIGLSHTADGEIPLELPTYGAVVLTSVGNVAGKMSNAGATPVIHLGTTPFAVPLSSVPGLGKGAYVNGTVRKLDDGFSRAETTLTKGGVDTFAFMTHSYARSPFPVDARGVAFKIRVSEANLGSARLGVFLVTKDRTSFYAHTNISLSRAGMQEVTCLFSEFFRHGNRGTSTLRVEDVRQVNIGYGGYYGQEGERVMFDIAAPAAAVLAGDK